MALVEKTMFWREYEIPYTEELDEAGYTYSVFFNYNGREGIVWMANNASVHVEWEDGDVLMMSFTPDELFGEVKQLDENQLKFIIAHLVKTEFTVNLSVKDINDMYQKYLDDKKAREKNE